MAKRERHLSSESLDAALHDFVSQALAEHSVEAADSTSHYLVALLTTFLRTDPQRLSDPLGPQLLEAASLAPEQQYAKLKQVADTTLFLSGIFLDHVEARLADTEYYFGVGSNAYLRLRDLVEARIPRVSGVTDTYEELGTRFETYAGVLAAISDRELFPSNSRNLVLYRRWISSGNSRDAVRLVRLGLIPSEGDDDLIH